MPTPVSGQVGEQFPSDGSGLVFRQGKTGEQIVSELHGRFYEQNYRGHVFSDGHATVQAITASTYNIGTLTASATPILGLWNPNTSTVNAVLLYAVLNGIKTALQNTGGGPFFWCTSVGNTAITTGNTPLNRKTLVQSGSFCKGFSGSVALTGLTNSLTVKGGSQLTAGSSSLAAFLETQAGMATTVTASKEVFDGEWIIPPGGVIALLQGSAPVAVSVAGMLVWEEVPL